MGMIVIGVLTVFWLVNMVLKAKGNTFVQYLATPLITLSSIGIALVGIYTTGLTFTNMCILIGLIVAVVADSMLMIKEIDLLKHGIVFFLITHIFYIIGLSSVSIYTSVSAGVTAAMIAIIVVMFNLLKNLNKELLIPVVVYMFVLCSMVVISFGVPNTPELKIGTICFLISDIILAIDAFVRPFNRAVTYTWLFYGPAQYIIALSCFKL
jgi:uncharacterized membrane protein YhhN